jgi:PAS domain S-box-containing protein
VYTPDEASINNRNLLGNYFMQKGEEWYQFLSSAVAQSFDGIAIADLEGKLMYVNPAWAQMHGYDYGEELVGRHLKIFHNQEQMDRDVEPFNKVVKEKGKNRGEMRHVRKDGTPFITLMTTTLLKDAQDKPVAILGIIKDITEHQQADKLLLESKFRYQNLIESTNDWVWEVDEDGRYTYVSPRIRDLMGYEPEEIVHKTPFDLMPPEEAKRVREIFATAVARLEPISSLENTNLHKEGHPVILETSGAPFFDARGKFSGYRGIDRDITERKQTENKLLQQTEKLEETNIALRVILRESEITKDALEQNVLSNIKDLLLPYVTELGSRLLDEEQQFFLGIIKANINEITSSFSRKLKLEFHDLTPREIQVADLIKQGRTNKEIARLLNITASGVDYHRRNLRQKINIKGKKTNLRSHLLSFVV